MSSNAPRRGLGRGLGSLIPTTPSQPPPGSTTASTTTAPDASPSLGERNGAPGSTGAGVDGAQVAGGQVAGAYFAELPITQVRPNARQPRQVFEEEALAELVHSIREVGLLQPVVVRRTGEDAYELIMGERIGRSRPQISNTLRLLKLSPAVQRRVAAGVLSAGHARALLSVDDAGLQDRLAARVTAEGISVRGLEEIVSVGTADEAAPRVTRNKPVAPGLDELADRLSDRLETRVKVDLGKAKGKITVEFASLDDLRRIVDIMDPRNRDDRPI
jgi:ParB family chromosome partitioning protein